MKHDLLVRHEVQVLKEHGWQKAAIAKHLKVTHNFVDLWWGRDSLADRARASWSSGQVHPAAGQEDRGSATQARRATFVQIRIKGTRVPSFQHQACGPWRGVEV